MLRWKIKYLKKVLLKDLKMFRGLNLAKQVLLSWHEKDKSDNRKAI